MSKAIIPLEEAKRVADLIVGEIDQYCEKIDIAGSIRRQEPFVGDIEIVCQPKLIESEDLFGDVTTDAVISLANISRDLGSLGLWRWKGKSRYQQWIIPYSVSGWQNQEINLDLFFVHPPADWGVIFLIRTGPHQFSKKMVSARTQGGYLPKGHRIEGGRIINGYTQEKVAEINTEHDYFKFCGMKWISPEKRSAAVLSR